MLRHITRFLPFRSFAKTAGQFEISIRHQNCDLSRRNIFGKQIPCSNRMASGEAVPIAVNNRLYRTVQEGQATILAPYQRSTGKSNKVSAQTGQPRNNDEGDQAVFYNPIQQYNRDLSVLAILVYGEGVIQMKQVKHASNLKRSRDKAAAKAKSAQALKQQASNVVPSSSDNVKGQVLKRTAEDAGLEQDVDTETQVTKKRADGDRDSSEDIDVQELSAATTLPETAATQPPLNGVSESSTNSPAQQRNKRAWEPPFTILDALSASGLRAIRYAKEIPFATKVVANDVSPDAVEAINLNIEHNQLKGKVFSHVGDARHYMYSKTGNEEVTQGPDYVHKFDVIDLDPYGTAASFFDAAIQALADGGLLCVTCTDAGVWASNGYPEKTYALYGGIPLKGAHSHEAGLRLILHAIATSASKYGIAIEPLLSLSIDFYARLFIRVHKSQQDVKLMAGTTMFVYNCDQGCGAWQTQLLAKNQSKKAKNDEMFFKHGFAQAPSTDRYCEHCGTKTHLGGPMWAGPLHNPMFIRNILNKLPDADKTIYGTTERIKGMLTVALEEEEIAWPLATSKENGKNSASARSQELVKEPGVDSISSSSAVVPRMPPQLLSPSPLFFLPTYLAKILSLPTPPEDLFRSAFLGLGYTCSRSHCKPGSFKTDAPWKVVWEIVREYGRQHQSQQIPRLLGEGEFEDRASVKKSSPGWNILKRLRHRKGNTLAVARAKENLLQQLGDGNNSSAIENASDFRRILQSALYDLDHSSDHIASEASTAPAVTSQEGINGSVIIANATSSHSVNGNNAKDSAKGLITDAGTVPPPKISGKALIDSGGDPSELVVVFDAKLGRDLKEPGGKKLVRYQVNPRANWGPMVRAGAGII